MKRKYIAGVILGSALVAALIYFYGGHKAPSGQPPLRNLTAENVGEIRDEFNAATNDVRVLLLLSPT